jgi:hypothetical protein
MKMLGCKSPVRDSNIGAAAENRGVRPVKYIFVWSIIGLLPIVPLTAAARSTDQQADEAYELSTSGCVATNGIPFFKRPPDAVSRQETDGAVDEQRRYGKSEVRTHLEDGKLFIERLTVPADSVPDDLNAIFALSQSDFFSRYGVGTRRNDREYIYADGLAELGVRFEKTRLVELKWTCGRD